MLNGTECNLQLQYGEKEDVVQLKQQNTFEYVELGSDYWTSTKIRDGNQIGCCG